MTIHYKPPLVATLENIRVPQQASCDDVIWNKAYMHAEDQLENQTSYALGEYCTTLYYTISQQGTNQLISSDQ